MYSNEPVVVGLRVVPVGDFDGVKPDDWPAPKPVVEVQEEPARKGMSMLTIAGGVVAAGGGVMVLTTTLSANKGPASPADFGKLQVMNTLGWGLMFGGVGMGVVPFLSTGPMLQIHGEL